jgi:hypothetical protein
MKLLVNSVGFIDTLILVTDEIASNPLTDCTVDMWLRSIGVKTKEMLRGGHSHLLQATPRENQTWRQ